MVEVELYGMTLAQWRAIPWWPEGHEALLDAGYPGHDREITVNIDGFDGYHTQIPEDLVALLRQLLPETWKLENRGSRIEIHPSGRFAGGFEDADIDTVAAALPHLGLQVSRRV